MDKKFIDMIASILNISSERLKEDSTADTISEWDSLSHWVIISEIEEEYGIEFTMEEATEFKNLGNIYEILMKKLQALESNQ